MCKENRKSIQHGATGLTALLIFCYFLAEFKGNFGWAAFNTLEFGVWPIIIVYALFNNWASKDDSQS